MTSIGKNWIAGCGPMPAKRSVLSTMMTLTRMKTTATKNRKKWQKSKPPAKRRMMIVPENAGEDAVGVAAGVGGAKSRKTLPRNDSEKPRQGLRKKTTI